MLETFNELVYCFFSSVDNVRLLQERIIEINIIFMFLYIIKYPVF